MPLAAHQIFLVPNASSKAAALTSALSYSTIFITTDVLYNSVSSHDGNGVI